jgi:hypothetical protein
MALEITHLVKEADGEHVEATERLCLTEDQERLVPESDPDARWLFCAVGARISKADAERYGLVKAKAKPQDKAVRAPQADKASRKPAEDG